MSKAWIGAAGALVLIAAFLTFDFDVDAPRAVLPASAIQIGTALADASTAVQSDGAVVRRATIDSSIVANTPSESVSSSVVVFTPSELVTPSLVPVRGRLVIMDPRGVERTFASGQLLFHVDIPERSKQSREVAVDSGRFELAVPRGASVRAVSFSGRPDTDLRTALLEEGASGAFAGPDPVEVHEPSELVVRGRWVDEALLHVVSDAAIALTGIEVRRRAHWPGFAPGLHPGDVPEVTAVVTGGDSPIALPDPGQGLRIVPYWVRAPGFAWQRIDLDHDLRGEHTVQLVRGGVLELRATGAVPEGDLFLRLCAPDEEEQPCSSRSLAEVSVGHDGRAQLQDLQPGRYAARLDRGSNEGTLTLAHAAVVVALGETTWLDLAVDPAVLAPRRVHLTGTLALPPGFTPVGHELRLDIEPRAQGQAQVRLPLASMARLDDQPSVLAWDAGDVLPALYRATITELNHRELVAARGAEPVAHLVLPPIARVSITIVDAGTGAVIELAHLFSSARVVRDPDSGRFCIHAPQGSLELVAQAPNYSAMWRTLDIHGDSEFELALDRVTGVRLSYYDGDRRLVIASEVQGLLVLDPDSGAPMNDCLLNLSATPRVSQLDLRPGRYELRFERWPAMWSPIAPIVVEVPAQTLIDVRIPVRRR